MVLMLVGTLFSPAPLWAQRGENFKFPVFYDKTSPEQTNRLKTLITGAEAQVLGRDLYYVKQMRIESFDESGKTNLIAKAPECLLNAETRTASSTNRLELESGSGLRITGQGFLCYLTNFNLIISNRVQTVIREELMKSSRALGPTLAGVPVTQPSKTNAGSGTNIYMTIRSDRFFLNYPSNLIHYTDNVQVESQQMNLSCETLAIRRATNGALRSIVAERKVTMVNKQDGSRATGDKATYSVNTNNEFVELTGHAHWQDGPREGQAERFQFDPKNNVLRGERNASLKLPRGAVNQPELLLGKPATAFSNQNLTASSTNQFIEINSDLLTIQFPTTNRPTRSITFETNVVIFSPADKTRATGNRATYTESTGLLELSGQAVWQADQRVVKGEALLFDRTNRVFSARRNAYLKLPVAAIGKQTALSSKPANPQKAGPPQFIEVFASDIDYHPSVLTFRERVRANFLEGETIRGQMTAEFLSVKFSNQVERLVAKQKVTFEDFPVEQPDGRKIAKRLDCELFTGIFSTNGQIDRLVAETNVLAQQTEWRKTAPEPVRTKLGAQTLAVQFFPQSNEVSHIVAERDVSIMQDQRRAHGEMAVYTSTNQVVVLTGNPTAEAPEVKVTEADVVIWDRLQNKFYSRKFKASVVAPAPGTNRSNLRSP